MFSLNGFWSAINNFIGGGDGWFSHSSSHQPMTFDKAMTFTPVWSCVQKICGAFVVMELELIRKQNAKQEVQYDHVCNDLVQYAPNTYQTPSIWKQTMMCHALMWGNARSYVYRTGRNPTELIPLMPDRTVSALVEGHKLHATLINRDDRISLWEDMQNKEDQVIVLEDRDVWHLQGLGSTGVSGKSLFALARESWEVGLNSRKHVSSQQKKGYAGGLQIEAPVGAFRNEDDAKEWLTKLKKILSQDGDGEKIWLLREGMKAHVHQMSNADAQFVEQVRIQREDEALRFGIEQILGDSTNASYNSFYEKTLAYRVNCLSPWTTKIEEESNAKLLSERERSQGYFFSFDDRTLLRMDVAAMGSFISQMSATRTLTKNENRSLLGYNPVEGGDIFENPAIDKVKPDNGAGGAANTPDPKKATENKATTALLSHLFGVEANRITSGAEKASNFIEWMDNFYSKKWESVLADNMEAMGLDRELATIHCTESKRRLLEVCDYSTAETLVENVKKCVSNWKLRSNSIGVLENV